MPKYLRDYEGGRWVEEYTAASTDEEISAYTVYDVSRTRDFSIWLIEDNCTYLNTLLAALASRKYPKSRMHFYLIDQSLIDNKFKEKLKQTDGQFQNKKIDRYHYNIKRISVRDAIDLVKLFSEHGEPNLIPNDQITDIGELIRDEFKNGNITVQGSAQAYGPLSERYPDVFPPLN